MAEYYFPALLGVLISILLTLKELNSGNGRLLQFPISAHIIQDDRSTFYRD